ncbi:MAG: recombinase family protein [Alphaproteobacteria bacterium]
MGKKAAIYLRVSTARQAEKDLSIPDQRRQLLEYCEREGWEVVAEYSDRGLSATDDNRPGLQEMIAAVTEGNTSQFDYIVVHSFSRFFRDMYQFEFYVRKLEKRGVSLVSITQQTGDDPAGNMVRQIFSVFDEYQSRENAKHVVRAMKENARQGFWNGAVPPYGYRTVAAETRGSTVKKRLEIEPQEAEIVRDIFQRYLRKDGVRTIASDLNTKGLRYRKGRPFSVSLVHQILTRTTYMGKHFFNRRNAKTKKLKDRSEWIEIETPVIIEPERFEKIQKLLEARRPTNTAPRIVNGPTLLTGVAKCARCGGGMTLRTGKGGKYRYYACNKRVTEGKSVCDAPNVPMDFLDTLVVDQLETRLLNPDRLKLLLQQLGERAERQISDTRSREKEINVELRKVEEAIDRLYTNLAEGVITDSGHFRTSLSRYEQRHEELLRLKALLSRKRDIPANLLSNRNLENFASAYRELLNGNDSKLRKEYIRLLVDRVEVDEEEIRISGSKAMLAHSLMKANNPDRGKVPSFVREWWAM